MKQYRTLANCNKNELPDVQRRLHPGVQRRTLIFAAGALDNHCLLKGLGSQECAEFYDGMVAAGLIEKNPYWPEYGERKQ